MKERERDGRDIRVEREGIREGVNMRERERKKRVIRKKKND